MKKILLISLVIFLFLVELIAVKKDKEDIVRLPKVNKKSELSIEEVLENRRSRRNFSSKPLQTSDISQILWAAYGVTKKIDKGPSFLRGGLRTAPSAGALYPLEIYIVIKKAKTLNPGIYAYDSEHHLLRLISIGNFLDDLADHAFGQDWIGNASACLVYSAVFERTTDKYGKRGRDRYVCMDLGHSAQNVYLQCEALGLATCAVGSFNDSAIKKTIKMSKRETPLYLMPLGYKK